jgi:hypothetical protein
MCRPQQESDGRIRAGEADLCGTRVGGNFHDTVRIHLRQKHKLEGQLAFYEPGRLAEGIDRDSHT